MGIIAGGTWIDLLTKNNNINATVANLAFESALSTDATPVLRTGSGSLARDFVVNNEMTTPLTTDQIGQTRVGLTDAGAFENQNLGLAVAVAATNGYVLGVGTYDTGTAATLTAIANSGCKFVNWTENGVEVGTSTTYTIASVTSAHNLVANFVTKDFLISISTVTGGTVTGGNYFDATETATVIATPSTGYSFVNWTENGTEVSTLATYAFTVSAARTLVANFIVFSAVPEVKQEKFIIIKDNVLTFSGTSGSIEIFNALGKLVVSQKLNGNTLTLKNAGIYIVKNTSVDGVKVQKIMIN
jgi:hypothetical protein